MANVQLIISWFIKVAYQESLIGVGEHITELVDVTLLLIYWLMSHSLITFCIASEIIKNPLQDTKNQGQSLPCYKLNGQRLKDPIHPR